MAAVDVRELTVYNGPQKPCSTVQITACLHISVQYLGLFILKELYFELLVLFGIQRYLISMPCTP